MLKAIIFDMDGVLIDSMTYHADAWKTVLAEQGINITRQDIYDIEGSNHEGVISLMYEKAGKIPVTLEFDELAYKKREVFRTINQSKPFDGITECLDILKNKFRIGVVSGSDKKELMGFIGRFFPDVFDVVVAGDDVRKGKPSPEPYLKAVQILGIEKEECIVIENAPMGVESAKSAGLYCIAMPIYVEPHKLKKADVVLKNHAALFDYLATKINIPDQH
ncbi:MAG: HAD-IA family hydrolase [Nitrospirae bacterium]|nr:HAD-IA family hydrolase [Nitrospirota bacterium]